MAFTYTEELVTPAGSARSVTHSFRLWNGRTLRCLHSPVAPKHYYAISLAKLSPSAANVRRTGAGAGIEALAASIQAHGLLQSLVVQPRLDGTGQPTKLYEVVAGARRGVDSRQACVNGH